MDEINVDRELQLNQFIKELDLENNEIFQQFSVMLNLPDEQFEPLKPVVLDSLERSFNTPEVRLNFARALNSMELNLEDLEDFLNGMTIALQDSALHNLSKSKIDFLTSIIGILHNAFTASEGISKRIVKIPIEKCDDRAKAPTYANTTDSGMDVYALEDITIAPGETKLIPIGIKVALPRGYELQVRPKSGRSLKSKLRIANTPGTIDAGYRDEIGIIVENIEPVISDISYEYDDEGNLKITSIDFGSSHTIGAGEKFAQLVLAEVPKVSWLQVDSVTGIGEDRGGGFGSTGLK